MKGKIIRAAVAIVAVLGLLAAGWVWLTLHWVYAEGERTGYVQKLSKKGWLCKTWEGEIVLVTMPGAIPEKFEFTVRDEAVVDKINANAGKRVVLHYEQHKFIPTSCFGDTEYFIDSVRELDGTAAAPSPTPAQPPASAPAPNSPASALPPPGVQQGQLREPR